MSKIIWDAIEDRLYELGVSKGVLYRLDEQNKYTKGYGWNGLINVTESPSGADVTKLFADGIEYANMRAAEEYGASIEAYTYPDAFAECDGSAQPVPGVYIKQQTREPFGFCYRTEIGSAAKGQDAGYKLHLVYGLTASPSEKAHATINDSPEAATMSWDVKATPVPVNMAGFKQTAVIEISSLDHSAEKMAALEEVLYGKDASAQGNDGAEPKLPMPDEIFEMMKVTAETGN